MVGVNIRLTTRSLNQRLGVVLLPEKGLALRDQEHEGNSTNGSNFHFGVHGGSQNRKGLENGQWLQFIALICLLCLAYHLGASRHHLHHNHSISHVNYLNMIIVI